MRMTEMQMHKALLKVGFKQVMPMNKTMELVIKDIDEAEPMIYARIRVDVGSYPHTTCEFIYEEDQCEEIMEKFQLNRSRNPLKESDSYLISIMEFITEGIHKYWESFKLNNLTPWMNMRRCEKAKNELQEKTGFKFLAYGESSVRLPYNVSDDADVMECLANDEEFLKAFETISNRFRAVTAIKEDL